MISAVLLNWKRPFNTTRIVAQWRNSAIVNEMFVWNNDNHTSLQSLGDDVKIVTASKNLGVYPRFLVSCMASNDCILLQDDDLLLPLQTIDALYAAWRRDPAVIHGVFGRAARPDGTYGKSITGAATAPIVITRVALIHRRFCAAFWAYLDQFAELQRDSVPYGNGEDIIMSYIVRLHSQRLHQIHDLPVVELPDPHAISTLPGHYEHRTRLMQFCETWLRSRLTTQPIVGPVPSSVSPPLAQSRRFRHHVRRK